MAEARISVDQDEFSCPICLDLLKEPVTINCGHCFCMECINSCWDQEDQIGVYSCPQCRETFTPRPVLRRNNMLNEVVEKLNKTELQAASADHSVPGDVECDFCTGTKCKAVKSCLMCLASFCETHLKPHYEVPGLKKHTLIEASTKLHEKICSHHDEVLKIYCRTDQSFICYLCMMDEHKGHEMVTAKAERTEKQNHLEEKLKTFQQRIQENWMKVQELKQAMKTIKSCAQASVVDSERFFTEMIRSLEKKRSEVTKLIINQEKADLSQATELLQELVQEIADLKRRITELEKLSHTQDHIHFLQSFQSLCVSPGCENSPSITFNQRLLFNEKYLLDLKKHIDTFSEEEFPQHEFCYLTLDPNTVHRYLCLSERNRVLTWTVKDQGYSDHPERFDSYAQVLCKQGVSGRCYWEVEWSNDDCVSISVSYKGISRKGISDVCVFGRNNQSWSLRCSSSSLTFWHNNIKTELGVPSSSRIGVHVDHGAGTLSFYSISVTKRLLHRVQTTFTQPLYPGIAVAWGTVRLIEPKCFCGILTSDQ